MKNSAFVRRLLSAAAVTGLVATGSMTAAHPTVHAAGPVTLIFWNGPDTTGTVPTLIKNFNAMEKGKIKVVLQTQSATTDNYFTTLQRGLHAGSTTPDVFAGDVIWPAQLAGQNLILPVDKYFSKSAQSKYIAGTIQDVQYKGHAYGAPWFTDFGMIYYRKDLLQKYHMSVPTTWEQLQSEAKTLVAKKAVKEGFVFQGAQYEGLVCDALEYIRGAGGYVYPVSQANSTQAKAAQGLQTMASMISSGASPKAVTTYQESQTNNDFVDGLAAFARNWPYMWANVQAKGSKVIGKVGVTNMLHESGQKGYSTLGGWWLGINKNSKNPDAAWAFINYLISMSAQQYWAIHGGHAVALVAANKSDTVVKALPWLPSVTANLNLVPRPTSPVYNDISLEMQKDFHGVLAGSMSASAAIKATDSFIQMAEARFK